MSGVRYNNSFVVESVMMPSLSFLHGPSKNSFSSLFLLSQLFFVDLENTT